MYTITGNTLRLRVKSTVSCYCKLSEIYDFDIGIFFFEGLLEFFGVCKRFYTVNTIRIHVPKIFIFFFHMLFWGSAKPSFGWYKVTKNIYEATTTKMRLPGAPKLGT